MDTIDDLVADLEQFTTELEQVTTVTLQELASQLPNEIRMGLEQAGKNLYRPGSKGLRNSISATGQNGQFGLTMNYYGYYQIFGVKGSRRGALGLPASVAGAFAGKSEGDIFEFRKIKHPGIAPAPSAANPIINLADLIADTIIETIDI